jgi:SAM-dependent methyltransferase
MSVEKPASYTAEWERRGVNHILRRRTRAQFEDEGRRQAAMLQPFVDEDMTVLDFGCGVGRVARHLVAGRVVGVDVSRRFLAEAARNVECYHTDGLSVPLPDGSVDFAYSLMVLQHCARVDHPTILGEIARVLRPGGSAYVQFPNGEAGYYRDGPFVNVYTIEEVVSLVPDGCDGMVSPGRLAGYADGVDDVDRELFLRFTKD